VLLWRSLCHSCTHCSTLAALVQPLDLDAVLASAGCEFLHESEFMTASIADVLRVEADPRFKVTIAIDLDPTWYSHWCGTSEECDGDKDAGLQILKAVEDQSAFALCTHADVIVAVGRGVLADGWLGVVTMATYPLNRGAGAGKAFLAHLARWAAQNWGERRVPSVRY
jgi:GNAT superfamily N-acetyltransferase